MSRLTAGQYRGADEHLARATQRLGGEDYLVFLDSRPSTPTITNVPTTDAGWTAIATGLSNVIKFRLSERGGNDFRYAFVAAPAAYMTGFGWIEETSNISAIYVQRPTTTDLNMELLVWKV